MGTLFKDVCLICNWRDFMLSLSDNIQADVIEAFNSSSRYLDDLLDIDNPYFKQMIGQIYPTELQLNKSKKDNKISQIPLILKSPFRCGLVHNESHSFI